jgi:hypothetical protein
MSLDESTRLASEHTFEIVDWMVRTFSANVQPKGVLRSAGAIVQFADEGNWPDRRVVPAPTADELRQRSEASARRERDAERESQRRDLEHAASIALRERYGPKLDSMGVEQVQALARQELDNFSFGRWRKNPTSDDYRDQLIEALAKQHVSPET